MPASRRLQMMKEPILRNGGGRDLELASGSGNGCRNAVGPNMRPRVSPSGNTDGQRDRPKRLVSRPGPEHMGQRIERAGASGTCLDAETGAEDYMSGVKKNRQDLHRSSPIQGGALKVP